jgi:single-stranded-DNA-specific exonuclease
MKPGKRWEIQPEPDPSLFKDLHPIPKPIADPFLLADMPKAADRILQAVRSGERVAVFGDYDTDGVTATAMMVDYLQSVGAVVSAYIPSRFEEGYGLNCGALEGLAEKGVRLVITVDCGARSLAEPEFARQKGLDLIITDHHAPGDEEPQAYAFINPKRKGSEYPERNLAGVGVAYRLVEALDRRLGEGPRPPIDRYLDLVAIGTVADMVPLLGENRSLVQGGLKALNDPGNAGLRPGVDQLLRVSGVARGKLNAQGIGFMLGPRLNASGRLDTAGTALDLLLARDPEQAGEGARRLEAQNRDRQALTRSTVLEARSLSTQAGEWDPQSPPFFIMVEKEGFNPGVIGLAASKLMEEYYRPVAVVAIDGDRARGSIRSVPGFHITEALDSCRELLERYGGHAAAAGFTVRKDRLPDLRERLRTLAEAALAPQTLKPVLPVDSEIRLSEVSWDLHHWITRLEPCGQGNPAPVFLARNLRIYSKRSVGTDGSHLKLVLTDGRMNFDAIAFGLGHLEQSLTDTVDVVFALEENDYYGKQMQLRVMDIRGQAGS